MHAKSNRSCRFMTARLSYLTSNLLNLMSCSHTSINIIKKYINFPRKGRTINTNLTTQAFISASELGERARWGQGAVQRREKSGGRRGGAVGAARGFTKMKCCSRAPKGKMQVGKKKLKKIDCPLRALLGP
ncbi:hypothetical protein ACOSP7_006883 [Xanthoceras sorbifolium]